MPSTYRVKHSIAILASLDSDEKKVGFERSAESTIQTIRSDLEVGKADTRVIAAAAADDPLELGGVTTAKLLYIETDQLLHLKFNGGSEVLKLDPSTAGIGKLFWEGEFTSLTVSNPSSDNEAIVTYLVAGS